MTNLLIPNADPGKAAACSWTLSGQSRGTDAYWDTDFTDGYILESGLKWEGEGEGVYGCCVEALNEELEKYNDASHPVVCSVLTMAGSVANSVTVHSLTNAEWGNIRNVPEGASIAGAFINGDGVGWNVAPAQEPEEEEVAVEDDAF